jgi:phage tail-like protein
MSQYPLTALYFSVNWELAEGATASGAFSEVSGLSMEAEIVEYRPGNDLTHATVKQPGLRKFGNATLKRGIMPAVTGNGLYEWMENAAMGRETGREVTISLLNPAAAEPTPVMSWILTGAFPVKLEGPALKSTGTDVAIESLEFAAESIRVALAGASR